MDLQIQVTSELKVLQPHVKAASSGEREQQLAAEIASLWLQNGNTRRNFAERDSSQW